VDGDVHVYEHGGATIVVQSRATAPLVTVAFAFGAGESEESADRCGLTGLVTRTSLKGTPALDAAAIAERIESIGGTIGAAAGADMFQWSLGLPARHFAAGLDVLADVVQGPAFPEPELETERKAARGELDQLRDSMVAYPYRLMVEAAFEGHRYGATLDTLDTALRHASANDLAQWHRATVRHRAALILVVGDVDPDTAAAGVMDRVPAGAGGEPPPPAQFDGRASATSRVVERETAQTAIALGFPGPPRNHPDVDALRVLAAAVGGLGGRLVEELRSRRSLAYTVSVTPITRLAGGLIAGYIATSPEREDEARAGMFEETARLVETRLPEADVDRARRFLIGSRRIRLQTHSARLGELARALRLGRGIEEIRDYEARILAQDPESIRAAAERWLDPDRVAEGIVRGASRRMNG
jgi:zinc protease